MKFRQFSIILAFLAVSLVAAHDALPPEIYWKSKLPTTPMPELVKDLLHPTVNVGNLGGGATIHGVPGNDAIMPTGGDYTCSDSIYYKYQCNYVRTPSGSSQLHDTSNATIFFLEKDLKAGHKMNLVIEPTSSDNSSFLPRQVVKSIPFSSSKMDEILNKFGVKRGSAYANSMKATLELCEEPGVKGEEKYCATSLESMVDFVNLKLGKSVNALCMNATKKTKEQEYTIMHGVTMVGETLVVCHKLNYAYAVFLCHKIENTVAYTVSLQGADGRRVKAFSVCHRDTSTWSPKHMSFQLLKVKPGTVPICHFLAQGTVIWVPKQN